MPSLILQPIVENAVKYGVARRAASRPLPSVQRARGRAIGAWRSSIAGREPEQNSPGGGIGLTNVRQRLALLYGRTRPSLLPSARLMDDFGSACSACRWRKHDPASKSLTVDDEQLALRRLEAVAARPFLQAESCWGGEQLRRRARRRLTSCRPDVGAARHQDARRQRLRGG